MSLPIRTKFGTSVHYNIGDVIELVRYDFSRSNFRDIEKKLTKKNFLAPLKNN